MQINDPEETVHIIPDLTTYTQYLVSLQVINPEGLGPASTVVIMTDEGGRNWMGIAYLLEKKKPCLGFDQNMPIRPKEN